MPGSDSTLRGTSLTRREIEVLHLVREHLTNAEIAGRLFVSVRTVETHVSTLLRKMAVTDRRQLARAATPPDVAGSSMPSHLPTPLTTFIGRTDDLAHLISAARAHRLVTVTGPGGVGKTRLAIAAAHQLADDFSSGAVFVDLVLVTRPSMVMAAIADAADVPERTGGDRQEALLETLATRECLVVLDNCEHVQDAVRICVERLLGACPTVRVLATSRLRLMLPFEQVVAVPGLSLGSSPGEGDAVTLFADRMVAAGLPPPVDDSQWDTIREICASLDGMALAIELAAARVPGLGLDALVSGLDTRLHLLYVGSRADERHRSLRAAIDWTYDLLSDAQQAVLRASGTFAAPFGAQALCAVVHRPVGEVLDALGRLVDWNLVARLEASGRYRVLETIRQYADEVAVATGEAETLRRAHLAWVIDRCTGLRATAPGDDAWCAEVDAVADDARAALARASVVSDPDSVSVAGVLADVLFQRGHPAEAQALYEEAAAITAAREESPSAVRRWLLLAAGAAATRNVGAEALELLEEAAGVAQASGDQGAAAQDLASAAALQRRAQGIIRHTIDHDAVERQLQRARSLGGEDPSALAAIAVADAWLPAANVHSPQNIRTAIALSEAAADPLLLVQALDQLSTERLNTGDLERAAEAVGRRFEMLASVPLDAFSGFEYYDAYHMGCHINLGLGRLPAAHEFADGLADLPFFREQRHIGLGRRIEVNTLTGDFDAVKEDAEQFEHDWLRAGRPVAGNLSIGAYAAATVFGMTGDDRERARWIDIALALLSTPPPMPQETTVWRATLDALLALHHDDYEGALAQLTLTPNRKKVHAYYHLWLPWYAAVWAEASALSGAPETSARIAEASKFTHGNRIVQAMIDRSVAIVDGESQMLDGIAARFSELGCPYQAARTAHLGRHAFTNARN